MSMRVSVYESFVFISNDGLDSELKGGGGGVTQNFSSGPRKPLDVK